MIYEPFFDARRTVQDLTQAVSAHYAKEQKARSLIKSGATLREAYPL